MIAENTGVSHLSCSWKNPQLDTQLETSMWRCCCKSPTPSTFQESIQLVIFAVLIRPSALKTSQWWPLDFNGAQTCSMNVVRKIHDLWWTILDFCLFSSCFILGDVFCMEHCCTPDKPHRCMRCMSDQDLELKKLCVSHCKQRVETLETGSWKLTITYYTHLSIYLSNLI